MSLMQACAYVPEMLLNAPTDIQDAEVSAKIDSCVGVAFMKLYRIGCIVTVRGGEGVIVKKREDGSFSAPVALNMLGPAVGASIGFERSDYIMFIQSEEALAGLLGNVMTTGINGALAAGPVGRTGEAMITTGSREGILVFGQTQGLYGGVSLEFSGILVDKKANQVQYQDMTPMQILNEAERPKGEVFEKMYKFLDKAMKEAKERAAAKLVDNIPEEGTTVVEEATDAQAPETKML
eukprot:CAMPEP_0203785824 /NCGR_PEP_ID=MMETSP0100_2-20121128/1251_1 /ASSEMBLY_ACC=CAM_ASM_000210 /TAXON_ID=96639 /ORGANISM=" , Strain NY0313808BC1" /LENGTH=236 /DNA_ID=CAMNT_0050687989 /DNA_START=51 /DNA_END=761 /DNA_ORIENTATION=+